MLQAGTQGVQGSRPGPEPARLPPPLQAVVLEGNYWKRRIEVVMREYHKWRIYYKKRVSGVPGGVRSLSGSHLSHSPPPPGPTPPSLPATPQ